MPNIAIYYDEDSDVAYFKLTDNPVAYSRVVDDLRWVDYASDGSVVGVQLFNASDKLPLLKRERMERELVLA